MKGIESERELLEVVRKAIEAGDLPMLITSDETYTFDGAVFLNTTTMMSESELDLVTKLVEASMAVTPGWELEVNHFCDEDDPKLNGWYAWEYNESYGHSRPLGGGDNDAIVLLDYEEKAMNVDMQKICNEYGCFVMY